MRICLVVLAILGATLLVLFIDPDSGEAQAPSLADPLPIPSGVSLVGWFGGSTDSAQLLSANPALDRVWWFDPDVDRWVVDAQELPSSLRQPFPIHRGTGFLAIARFATTLLIPSAGPLPPNVCRENVSPPDPNDLDIRVGTPFAGTSVTSPINVVGQVRFLDGVVGMQIRVGTGVLLADIVAQAALAAPETGDVKRNVSFSVDEPTAACLEVFEPGGEDGPINLVQIPVLLLP
jgi:hypothetical protein